MSSGKIRVHVLKYNKNFLHRESCFIDPSNALIIAIRCNRIKMLVTLLLSFSIAHIVETIKKDNNKFNCTGIFHLCTSHFHCYKYSQLSVYIYSNNMHMNECFMTSFKGIKCHYIDIISLHYYVLMYFANGVELTPYAHAHIYIPSLCHRNILVYMELYLPPRRHGEC